jgi:hypothetical protein
MFTRNESVAARRRRVLACAALAAWGLAAAAQAGDPPPPQQSSQPAADQPKKPDPQDRIICREDTETGSRIKRNRICHTKREWDQIAEDARRSLDGNQVSQQLPR